MRLQRYSRRLAALAWLAMATIAIAGFAAFDPPTGELDPLAIIDLTEQSATRAAIVGLAPSPNLAPAPTVSPQTDRKSTSFDQPLPVAVKESRFTTPPTTTTTTTSTTLPPTTTTTTTTTTPPVPTTTPTEVEQWRPLVSVYFPEGEIDHALKVLWCESRGTVDATHPTSFAAGLFQHLPKYWSQRSIAAGFAGADIYEPTANVGVAAWLVTTQGWYHWDASKHCWG